MSSILYESCAALLGGPLLRWIVSRANRTSTAIAADELLLIARLLLLLLLMFPLG